MAGTDLTAPAEAANGIGRLRIALVAPVAQPVPPPRSGSIETVTDLLARGLVARGHDVTLFAPGSSETPAALHATFREGYHADASLWPWELCELFNLAAAVERAADFDVIHAQAEYAPLGLAFARVARAPMVQTVHHWPSDAEVALWSRYPEAPFVAVSAAQAERLRGLTVAGVVHHAVDTDALQLRADPDDYVLFFGRFTPGKGVLAAVDAARRAGLRLLLAAGRKCVLPRGGSRRSSTGGRSSSGERWGRTPARSSSAGRARWCIPCRPTSPSVSSWPRRWPAGLRWPRSPGAPSPSWWTTASPAAFSRRSTTSWPGCSGVTALDRARVRARAVQCFGPDRMVDGYLAVYSALVAREAAAPRKRASEPR